MRHAYRGDELHGSEHRTSHLYGSLETALPFTGLAQGPNRDMICQPHDSNGPPPDPKHRAVNTRIAQHHDSQLLFCGWGCPAGCSLTFSRQSIHSVTQSRPTFSQAPFKGYFQWPQSPSILPAPAWCKSKRTEYFTNVMNGTTVWIRPKCKRTVQAALRCLLYTSQQTM